MSQIGSVHLLTCYVFFLVFMRLCAFSFVYLFDVMQVLKPVGAISGPWVQSLRLNYCEIIAGHGGHNFDYLLQTRSRVSI